MIATLRRLVRDGAYQSPFKDIEHRHASSETPFMGTRPKTRFPAGRLLSGIELTAPSVPNTRADFVSNPVHSWPAAATPVSVAVGCLAREPQAITIPSEPRRQE